MPVVFRLVRRRHAKPGDLLSGFGAGRYGGRWNAVGTRVVDAASHESLALVEALVHAATLPRDMVLVRITLPDSPVMKRWAPESLPHAWATYPPPASTRRRGTAWIDACRDLAVWVPSAVVPTEWNCLINPAHPSIVRARAQVIGPFRFDVRLRP